MKKVILYLLVILTGYIFCAHPFINRGKEISLADLPNRAINHRIRFMVDDFSVLSAGLFPWLNPERTVTIKATPDFPFHGFVKVSINPFYREDDLVAAYGMEYAANLPDNPSGYTSVHPYPLLSLTEEGNIKSGKVISVHGGKAIRLRISFDRSHVLQRQLRNGISFVTRLDVNYNGITFPLWLRVRFPKQSCITWLLPGATLLFLLWASFIFFKARSENKKTRKQPLAGDRLEVVAQKEKEAFTVSAGKGILKDFRQQKICDYRPQFSITIDGEAFSLTEGARAGAAKNQRYTKPLPIRLTDNKSGITAPWLTWESKDGQNKIIWKLKRCQPRKRRVTLVCHKVITRSETLPSRMSLEQQQSRSLRALLGWGLITIYVIYLFAIKRIF